MDYFRLFENFEEQEIEYMDHYLSYVQKIPNSSQNKSKIVLKNLIQSLKPEDFTFTFERRTHTNRLQYKVSLKSSKKSDLLENLTAHIQIEPKFLNQFHIQAVHENYRGIGFGYLVYLASVKHFGYLFSRFLNSTEDAQRVWRKLIQDPKLYSAINHKDLGSVMVIDKAQFQKIWDNVPEIQKFLLDNETELDKELKQLIT